MVDPLFIWIEPGFQLLIVQVFRNRPGEPGRRGPIERLGHRAPRHATTGRDLPVTEPAAPFESKNIFDLSHGHSLRWHQSLPHKLEGTRYLRLRRTCAAIGSERGTAGEVPRPGFRGMSATDSEQIRNSGRIPLGISGRLGAEYASRRIDWMCAITRQSPSSNMRHHSPASDMDMGRTHMSAENQNTRLFLYQLQR